MIYCKLCEEEYAILYSLCESCRKIKHYMNIYTKPRIIEILDNILSRDIQKQNNKIKLEITEEIKNKEKKTKELIENYEKLKKLETQSKEDKLSEKKENKKINKKKYNKKRYYKKIK